jgi:hypothetical protein
MNKSSKPRRPVTPGVDQTVPIFRAYLLCTTGVAVLFGLSWLKDRGLGPLIQGVLLSFTLVGIGATLLLTVRARALAAPTSIRPWMRPTAWAIVVFSIAVAGSTIWRWYA